MTSMSDTQNSSSHGKLIAAVVAAALVVVLALISAFVWPGWALNKNGQAGQAGQTSQQASTSNGTDGDKTEPAKPSHRCRGIARRGQRAAQGHAGFRIELRAYQG